MKPGDSTYLLEENQLLRNRVELLKNILKINNINPAIEQIKKRGYRYRVLKTIKEERSGFHEACNIGYLQVAMLDTNAIQNGLFVTSDDFLNVQFWEDAVEHSTDPAYSVRLISLKSYDMNCGTQFHLETMGF